MNIPIGEIIRGFFTDAGAGGIVVLVVFLMAAIIYYRLTRWIIFGSKEEKKDLFG
jgi:hypothetical protein